MPLVSVILPTHARNASGRLRAAIVSVLSQEFRDLELFVVDDGSVDGSAETIAELAARDPRIHHIRFEQNVGLPAFTSVDALTRSRGSYIAWQFDDCVWMPHHLTTLLKGFTRNPSAGVVYGRAVMKTTSADFVLGDAFDCERLRKTNFIPNCAALIRRDVIDPIGWFDPAVVLKRICDYDFWCRAAEYFPFEFCPEVVAEEHGVALADSLGNSVTLSARLAEKYRRTNRNALLNPANCRQWDPFAPPGWMDDSELDEFCFLVFEHFIRIKQVVKGARLVCRAFPGRFPGRRLQNGDGDDYLISAVFDWYLDGASRSRLALQMQLIDAHRYIDRLDGQLQNRVRAAMVKRLPQSLRGWARVR